MRILMAAIPPVRPLDVVGPVEVFGDANRIRGGDPVYSVEIVGDGRIPEAAGRPESVQRNARRPEPGPSIVSRTPCMDCGQHQT
jgi:hypothetical protein